MGANQGVQTKGYSSIKSDCIICLEKHYKGIYCPNNKHFICDGCFIQYVENILTDAGKLIDNNCKICCPIPECDQSWTTHQLRKILSSELFERYVDTLTNIIVLNSNGQSVTFNEDDIDAGAKAVINSLTLGCPSCKVALDPDPDGCCAIRCRSCSKYFCLLCFLILPDNTTCHSHVRKCPQNSSKNVFAPVQIRQNAQKILQIKAIRQTFRTKYGPKWRSINYTKQIIDKCSKVLKDSNITEEEILQPDEPDPQIQGQDNQTGLSKDDLYFSFFSGVLVTLFITFFYSLFFSSSTSSSTPMTCPTPSSSSSSIPTYDIRDSGNNFNKFRTTEEWDDYNEIRYSPPHHPSEYKFEPEQPDVSFITSFFTLLWNICVYLLKGGCWALALNYFTSQFLVDNLIIGILVALLWKPIGILLYYLSYLVTFILYYLNSSVLIIMIFMAVVNSQGNRNKYFISSIVLGVTLALLYVLKSFFE